MPGDTLIITSNGDSFPLTDTAIQHKMAALHPHTAPGSSNSGTGLLVFLCIIATPFVFSWLEKKLRQKLALRKALAAMRANFAHYDGLLMAYNGYYNSLSESMRKKFVERVIWFSTSKTFTCVDLEPDATIPFLISAASVQISFGLDKYMLGFFDTVYILRERYNYGFYQKPFEGHVNCDGIYLSWHNFRKGYENYADGDNVGIHEMAHALAYVNFMAGSNGDQDSAFIKRFYHFSSVARPIFNEMQNGTPNLLHSYATTNYNEFWAVAVETFFEKSIQMKIEMPLLYQAMCELLNQDPLLPDKILNTTKSFSGY